jgi:hypothetical protein
MERFCGSLLPAINNRRFPYRCIDRRILELAQVRQIAHIYGLKINFSKRTREVNEGELFQAECKL